jgi:hypothetical protein
LAEPWRNPSPNGLNNPAIWAIRRLMSAKPLRAGVIARLSCSWRALGSGPATWRNFASTISSGRRARCGGHVRQGGVDCWCSGRADWPFDTGGLESEERHVGWCCDRDRRRQALRLRRTAARLRGLTATPRSSVGHTCRRRRSLSFARLQAAPAICLVSASFAGATSSAIASTCM